jgi:hypothetical protein
MDILHHATYRVIGTTAADDFSVSQSTSSVVTGDGSTVTTTEDDATYSLRQGTTRTDSIEFSTYNSPALTNLNPENGTLIGTTLTPVGAGGVCTVRASLPAIGHREYRAVPIVVETSGYQYTLQSFPDNGSVMRHVYDTMVAAMAATPGLTGLSHRRFNVTDAPVATPNGTHNTGHWMYGVCDLTPISYSRQVTNAANPSYTQNYGLPATLIDDGTANSKFALIATHVAGSLPAGSIVNFLRSNGTFATMTTATTHRVVSGDLSLIMFTAPVTGIAGCKTLPTNWADYIPSVSGPRVHVSWGTSVPALFIGGQWRLSPEPSYSTSNIRTCRTGFGGCNGQFDAVGQAALAAQFNPRYWPVDIGDSSGPTGFPINGKFVILGTQYQASSGPSVVGLRTQVNSAMDYLSGSPGTYVFGTVDLSGFTSYA